jgi:3-oxoadipate enol-lactonase
MVELGTETVTPHRIGSGPPVVLLHCLGVDHRFWEFATGLADTYTLISYDLPGHGTTPVPAGPYAIADLSTQLARLMRRWGIERAHVAGISLGGLVAQHFAAHHRGPVDRLVLIDTTPRYTDDMRDMWPVRARMARAQGVAALVDDLLPIWFTPAFIAKDPPAVRYVREQLAATSGEGYALACEALAAADVRAEVARIKAPTMVVCGDEDIPSFRDAARWCQRAIPGAQLVWLVGTRHASVLQAGDRAVALLRNHLGAR